VTRCLVIIGLSLTLLWSVVAVWMFMDVRGSCEALWTSSWPPRRAWWLAWCAFPPNATESTDARVALDVIARDGWRARSAWFAASCNQPIAARPPAPVGGAGFGLQHLRLR
jgi:hypothetical protein